MNITKMRSVTCFCVALLLNAFVGSAQWQVVNCRRLVDGKGGVIEHATIIVRDNVIHAVGKSGEVTVPKGAVVHDLGQFTVLPGLIDAHTHLSYAWDHMPGTTPWESLERIMSNPMILFYSTRNAARTLESGVTTVRDLGSSEKLDIDLKQLILRGEIAGPRMFIAGNGLHVSNDPYLLINFRDFGKADGVEEVIRATRQQIMTGVDWIKVYGSTGSGNDVSGHQTYTLEEMQAACNIAHQHGLRVAIHAYGGEAARMAVQAGANSLEHSIDLDDATLSEMVHKGVYYVPTVDHNRYYADHAAVYGYSEAEVIQLKAFIRRNVETLRRAHQAGVKIVMGSDAVFTGFGENARELEWFIEAGMTPQEAIRSATSRGAELLGRQADLGNIAPGYLADVIAVEGNPLEDIQALTRRVRWVMKDGRVFVDKRPKLR